MANKIFNALLDEKIDIFINAFSNISKQVFYNENDKKIIHPGEFGIYRENICKDFISFFIPQKLKIESGFLINDNNEVSTQCDIIIYDYNYTPKIQSNELQKFFPVETVISVGEIKSTLNKNQFSEAIIKLSEVKKLKDHIKDPTIIYRYNNGKYNPNNSPYDQMITFLICKKLNFNLDNIADDIEKIYEKSEHRHRHNIILSIDDGIFLYHTGKSIVQYPVAENKNLKTVFTLDTKQNRHCKTFVHSLFLSTSHATVLYPEIYDYLGCDEWD